jgi:hypothetical protein
MFSHILQTLKCTTTPENRSVQTVQRSVRIVPCKPFSVPFSVRIVPCKPFSVPSKAFRTIVPPFGTPSVIHCKSACRMEIYKYFRKTIEILRLILSVYLRVYVLEREN